MFVYFIYMAWMTPYWAFCCWVLLFFANNVSICSWNVKNLLFAILKYILLRVYRSFFACIFSKFFRLSSVGSWHIAAEVRITLNNKKLHNLSALFVYGAHSVALFFATLHHSLLLYAWIPIHIAIHTRNTYMCMCTYEFHCKYKNRIKSNKIWIIKY